jgi:hypothetical protein
VVLVWVALPYNSNIDKFELKIIENLENYFVHISGVCGAMDNASDYESGD